MKSKPALLRRTARVARGVTLIEALVALLVMSFGMVALVGLMANLRRSGDVAKQRGEAMRLAQAELADLRSFALLTQPTGNPTTQYYDHITSLAPRTVTGANSNSSFVITRTVTPLIANEVPPQAQTMSVTVTWQDRANQQGSITLDSIVSRTDPAFSGATGITPPTNGIRTPSGRNPAIPVDATDLGNKTSAYRPGGGGTTVWVFNNLTGVVVSICTIDTAVSLHSASDLTGCTQTSAYFVSGTIRFSNTNPANPTLPEAIALPSITVAITLAPSQFTSKNAKGQDVLLPNGNTYPATPQCFTDAPSSPTPAQTFVNYSCIVYPNTQSPANWWGQVLVGGLSTGTDPTQFRVCRYSADYNGNGAIDNEEHPASYAGVTYSLARQNFLVVRGDVACPTAPAPDASSGIFIDYSTVQLQP